MHKANLKGLRRGIVIYYRNKYASVISKVSSSNKFDIIWLRIKSRHKEFMVAFFYAPGISHEEKQRVEFYDELRLGIEKFRKKEIYLLGDSNARLGEFSGDCDIHGNTRSNKNKTLFMGLLEYTGLKYLNRIYEKGKPTYEIWGKKDLLSTWH